MSITAVQDRYRRFADVEAPGRSALYEQWAVGIATDADAAAVIADLPADRRQPPLVFAAARVLGAPETDFAALADFLAANGERLGAELARRSLQTNEPQRCAALLPALARVPGPIALIELGASAGLCLLPDRYAYRYVSASGSTSLVAPARGSSLELECAVRGETMPQVSMPDIRWRAGADLHPLDVRDSEDAAWLRALVWPGEAGRAGRIDAAVAIAAADPPRLVAGDAIETVETLVAQAPSDTTIVVTTPGLLPFLPVDRRTALIDRLRSLAVRWITMDAPALHDAWTTAPPAEGFALALDGEVLASVDPLGAWMRWHAADPSGARDVGGPA